ncbi:MAG: hypothetical protein WCV85_00810 [Patescibacteria group bacterium]
MKKAFVFVAGLLMLSFTTAFTLVAGDSPASPPAQSSGSSWGEAIVLVPVIGLLLFFIFTRQKSGKQKQP